jgi:hypothetical protein
MSVGGIGEFFGGEFGSCGGGRGSSWRTSRIRSQSFVVVILVILGILVILVIWGCVPLVI